MSRSGTGYNVVVSNITNVIWLFFCLLEAAFKIHKNWRGCPLTLNGYDASDNQ